MSAPDPGSWHARIAQLEAQLGEERHGRTIAMQAAELQRLVVEAAYQDKRRAESKLTNLVVAGERLAFTERWLDHAGSWVSSAKLTPAQSTFVSALLDAKEA